MLINHCSCYHFVVLFRHISYLPTVPKHAVKTLILTPFILDTLEMLEGGKNHESAQQGGQSVGS